MSPRIAVVPGSFDPPTRGHLDVIRRAAGLFDQLHVLVVHNPGKEAMLPIAQRQALLEQSIQEEGIDGDVVVAAWSMGLLVDYATDVGAQVLVKGIRSQVDVAYETPMAIVNRDLAHVETVFLLPREQRPRARRDRVPAARPVACPRVEFARATGGGARRRRLAVCARGRRPLPRHRRARTLIATAGLRPGAPG